MKTEYKGITITERQTDMFETLGKEYNTMAAAKGAVTRWVNANVQAVQEADVKAAACLSQHALVHAANNTLEMQDATAIEVRIASQTKNEDAESAKVYAECVYYGLIKHGKAMTSQKYLSRNKREGGYCGRYKAGVKGFKMANYRVGPKGDYETLKQRSAWFKKWN